MVKKIEPKIECEWCHKMSSNWYKCHKKYFCSLPHLEAYEKKYKLAA